MKRAHLPALVALALVCVTLAAAGRGAGEIVLFDAPKGGWLGALRDDASLVVPEERNGWRHVRVEAWIVNPAAGHAGASGPTSRETGQGAAAKPTVAPAGDPGTVPAPVRRATVQGGLAPPLGAGGSARAGGLVLPVGGSGALGARHRKAGEGWRARARQKN